MTLTTEPDPLSSAQLHAQVAVAVEIYTIPFYLSALASIKDTKTQPAYATVLSVCTEEMLHLELAANICVALGTRPNFTAPVYGEVPTFPDGTPILAPSDDPATGDKGVLNATIGNLIDSIDTMLDIEVPTEYEQPAVLPPYQSIGQMYDALLVLVQLANPMAPYPTTNQQNYFGDQWNKQIITKFTELQTAVEVICEQGEGKTQSPPPSQPFVETDFMVPDVVDRLQGTASDPPLQAQYNHFGRFIDVQNSIKSGKLTQNDVYSGTASPGSPENLKLQADFAALITALNTLWNTGAGSIWGMTALLDDATAVWKAGNIPQWTAV